MRKSQIYGFMFLCIVAITVKVSGAGRETIYTNDFGTTSQIYEWENIWLGSPSITYAPDIDTSINRTNRDNDNLAFTLIAPDNNGNNWFILTKKISAPPGYRIKNPEFSIWTRTSRINWASWTKTWLSTNGFDWEYETLCSTGENNQQVNSSVNNDLDYSYLSSVWIKTQSKHSSGVSTPWGYRAKVWDASVTAELVPIPTFNTVGIYGWHANPVDLANWKITPSYTGTGVEPGKVNVNVIYPFQTGVTIQDYIDNTDDCLETLDLDNIHNIVIGEENHDKDIELNAIYAYIKENYPAVRVYQWMTPMQYYPNTALNSDGWVMDSYGIDGNLFRKMLMRHLVTGKPVLACLWASPSHGGFGDYSEMHTSTEEQFNVCKEFGVPVFFYAVSVSDWSVNTWLNNTTDSEIINWRTLFYDLKNEAANTDITALPIATANKSAGDDLKISGNTNGNYAYTDDFSTTKFIDRATIEGFLNLRWDYINHKLYIEPKPDTLNAENQTDLIYEFNSDQMISQICTGITGSIRGKGTKIEIALSLDGTNWQNINNQDGVAGQTNTFNISAIGGSMNGTRFWMRIRANVPEDGDAWIALEGLNLTAEIAEPASMDIELAPDVNGNVSWLDDFESQNYLHHSTITNSTELYWNNELDIYMHSKSGSSNAVKLRQKFVCDENLTNITARIGRNLANYSNWASFNSIAISIDGTNKLASTDTTGYAGTYREAISVNLPIPEGTKVFYVHYEMQSNSGLYIANPTNRIDDLEVTAMEK